MRFTITIEDEDHERLMSRWRETGATVAEQVRRGIRMWLGTVPLERKGSVDEGRVVCKEPVKPIGKTLAEVLSKLPAVTQEQEIPNWKKNLPVVEESETEKKIPVASGEYIQDDDLPGDFMPVKPDPVLDTTAFDDVRPKRGKK